MGPMSTARYFAQTYAEARDKFFGAARLRGLGVETHVHPLPGRDGEMLAMDVARDGPRNAHYDELAELIVPEIWPPDEATRRKIERFVAERGDKALQQAVSSGQYHHPKGVFFGGTAPTWSQETLRQVLRDHGTRCAKLAWIDLHTGLGPSGHGERIFACRDDAKAYARAKEWWGPMTSIYDGSSTAALLTGMMWR